SDPRVEREGAGGIRDEDLSRKVVSELALEARLETREQVVEAGPAAVGPHHRRAAGVAAEEDLGREPALREVGDELQDRRVRPVLRAAGTVELEPGTGG